MERARASRQTGRAVAIDWQAELASHDRWLRSVVLARVGEFQAVDDVMQEIALAAVRQSAPLTDPGKVAAWLYRLAVRQSLLYRRTMGRRRKLANRYAERAQTGGRDTFEPDPLQWLLADERRELIRRGVASLPPKDAEILLLKYNESWSYKQIAELMSTSVSAVESRLHRARLRLREQLVALEVVESK
jgi:RNA polymerase sigma-70 factor (ECF subfamily)